MDKIKQVVKANFRRLFPDLPLPSIYVACSHELRCLSQRVCASSLLSSAKVQNGDNNRKLTADENLVPTPLLRDCIPEIVCSTEMLAAQLISWIDGKRRSEDASRKLLGCAGEMSCDCVRNHAEFLIHLSY